MAAIPQPVTVRIAPGGRTGPRTYHKGYVVIPLVPAHLTRAVLHGGMRVETLIEHEPNHAYFYEPPAGAEITIENHGGGESAFQKILGYPYSVPTEPQPALPIQTIELVGNAGNAIGQFRVEMATTLSEQVTGLIGRPGLTRGHGMMMDFGKAIMMAVWMKNMRFSIDALFIGPDGKVSKLVHDLQPNDMTPVSSDRPVRALLELQGGLADRIGAAIGATIRGAIFP